MLSVPQVSWSFSRTTPAESHLAKPEGYCAKTRGHPSAELGKEHHAPTHPGEAEVRKFTPNKNIGEDVCGDRHASKGFRKRVEYEETIGVYSPPRLGRKTPSRWSCNEDEGVQTGRPLTGSNVYETRLRRRSDPAEPLRSENPEAEKSSPTAPLSDKEDTGCDVDEHPQGSAVPKSMVEITPTRPVPALGSVSVDSEEEDGVCVNETVNVDQEMPLLQVFSPGAIVSRASHACRFVPASKSPATRSYDGGRSRRVRQSRTRQRPSSAEYVYRGDGTRPHVGGTGLHGQVASEQQRTRSSSRRPYTVSAGLRDLGLRYRFELQSKMAAARSPPWNSEVLLCGDRANGASYFHARAGREQTFGLAIDGRSSQDQGMGASASPVRSSPRYLDGTQVNACLPAEFTGRVNHGHELSHSGEEETGGELLTRRRSLVAPRKMLFDSRSTSAIPGSVSGLTVEALGRSGVCLDALGRVGFVEQVPITAKTPVDEGRYLRLLSPFVRS